VGSEYFINSQELEDKVRNLLPSQGGAGAGFDLSASTQIIPIIDLTESAEGSDVRADLQTALSLNSITAFAVTNTTTTIVNNTGYFRVFGNFMTKAISSVDASGRFNLTDGVTSKIVTNYIIEDNTSGNNVVISYDFIVFLSAGDSLTCTTANGARMSGSTRQIATIDGVLVNPT